MLYTVGLHIRVYISVKLRELECLSVCISVCHLCGGWIRLGFLEGGGLSEGYRCVIECTTKSVNPLFFLSLFLTVLSISSFFYLYLESLCTFISRIFSHSRHSRLPLSSLDLRGNFLPPSTRRQYIVIIVPVQLQRSIYITTGATRFFLYYIYIYINIIYKGWDIYPRVSLSVDSIGRLFNAIILSPTSFHPLLARWSLRSSYCFFLGPIDSRYDWFDWFPSVPRVKSKSSAGRSRKITDRKDNRFFFLSIYKSTASDD